GSTDGTVSDVPGDSGSSNHMQPDTEQRIAQINSMQVSQAVKDAAIQQVKDGSPLSAPELVRFYSAQQPKQMGGGMPRMETPLDSMPMQMANPNRTASGSTMPGNVEYP